MIFLTLTLWVVFQITATQSEETNIYFQNDFLFLYVNHSFNYYEAHVECRLRHGILAHFGNPSLYQLALTSLSQLEMDRYYFVDLLYAKRHQRYYWPNRVSYMPHGNLLPRFPFWGEDTKLGCIALFRSTTGISIRPKSCDDRHYALCLIRENFAHIVNETDYYAHDFLSSSGAELSNYEARATCYEENGVLAYISNPTLSNIADQQLTEKLRINTFYHVDLLYKPQYNSHYFPNGQLYNEQLQRYKFDQSPTTGVCVAIYKSSNEAMYRPVSCNFKAQTLCLIQNPLKTTTTTTRSTTSIRTTRPTIGTRSTRPTTSIRTTRPTTSTRSTRPTTSTRTTRPTTSTRTTSPTTTTRTTRPTTITRITITTRPTTITATTRTTTTHKAATKTKTTSGLVFNATDANIAVAAGALEGKIKLILGVAGGAVVALVAIFLLVCTIKRKKQASGYYRANDSKKSLIDEDIE